MLTAANDLLPKCVAVLLAAAIAWQLAGLAWMLVPALPPAGEAIESWPARAVQSGSSVDGAVDVQAIAGAHLFGAPSAAAPTTELRPVVHKDLEETRLNLSLKGTIASTNESIAAAIIAAAGKEDKVYALEDTVAPRTTLYAIYPDRVILNRIGVLEALKLSKDFPGGGAPTRSAEVSRRAPDPAPSIRQVISDNVTKLANVIRPRPYFVGGHQRGYQVYPGRNRKQFEALGLRPGDLIKSINGAVLTDPQTAMEIFRNLGTTDQVTMTVERNGQSQVLTLSTSQLNLETGQ